MNHIMNINRNNYEEYFLLYADNELPVAEKNMVEVFVAENPDLQEELMMLQQSIVKAEEIPFPGKENLLRVQPFNAEMQEKLLSLLDNELTEKEKQPVIASIKKDKAVEKEWQSLQQAKLPTADTIIYTDKASLYKNEENERRVVPFKWWQLAAAAMLIGFGLWGTVSYLNRSVQPDPSIATSTKKQTIKPGISKASETNDLEKTAAGIAPGNELEQNSGTTAAAPVQPAAIDEKILMPTENVKKTNLPKENNELVHQDINKNTSANGLQNINNNDSNKTDIAIVPPPIKEDKPVTRIETIADNATAKNDYAVNTAVSGGSDEIGFGDEDEDDKPRKTKLGAFFKKAKRTFERKTKIKTGSGDDVRIANMSFAMH